MRICRAISTAVPRSVTQYRKLQLAVQVLGIGRNILRHVSAGKTSRSQPSSVKNDEENTTPWQDPMSTSAEILSLVMAGSEQHHDLRSFERYAAERDLNKSSTVYVGVRYEYTVRDTLARYAFDLKRVGRASDKGIDLVGYWHLPGSSRSPMRVLGQCKAAKATPSMIRELEGAIIGAPAAWRTRDMLVLLATSTEATKGVREAVSRSRVPMGFVNISNPQGVVRQFLWNQAASAIGLKHLNAIVRYGGHKTESGDTGQELCLMWQDKPWAPKTTV